MISQMRFLSLKMQLDLDRVPEMPWIIPLLIRVPILLIYRWSQDHKVYNLTLDRCLERTDWWLFRLKCRWFLHKHSRISCRLSEVRSRSWVWDFFSWCLYSYFVEQLTSFNQAMSFQLLGYQMVWWEGQIWYYREIGPCRPPTEDWPFVEGHSSVAGLWGGGTMVNNSTQQRKITHHCWASRTW